VNDEQAIRTSARPCLSLVGRVAAAVILLQRARVRLAGRVAAAVILLLPAAAGSTPQPNTAPPDASPNSLVLSYARRMGVIPQGSQSGRRPLVTAPQSSADAVLYAFENSAPQGANPAALIRDPEGNLYGVAFGGGFAGFGGVFKVNPAGHVTVLYMFTGGADGGYPSGRLIRDAAGNLYGTTEAGGTGNAGTVFKLGPGGDESVLYSFTAGADGGYPTAGVIRDAAGNLYGTAYLGGLGSGVVFKLDAAGHETVLYAFTGGTDGALPFSRLVLDSAGNLFGTTGGGGDLSGCSGFGCGVVFKLDRSGHETVLYSFTGGADGAGPSDLVLDAAGNLFGAASVGGNLSVCGGSGCGVVFKLDSTGHQTVLYTFQGGNDGAYPGDVTRNVGGKLVGNTDGGGAAGAGVLFKLDGSGNETVLYTFQGGSDGSGPNVPIVDSAGNLFGTTFAGGAASNGTVFRVDSSGIETQLYAFPGNSVGESPYSGVINDGAGHLYGTTLAGGATNSGLVYEIGPSGKEKVLYEFQGGADGANPVRELVRDPDGNLYGTTSNGGMPTFPGGCGVVYKLSPSGVQTVLHTFTGGADGCGPFKLLRDAAGNLYGTSLFGSQFLSGCSSFGCGLVFKLDPSGNLSVLHSFAGGSDGYWPLGLVMDKAGNLYGTTAFGGPAPFSGGVVFKIDTSGNESVLYTFTGGADGNNPRDVILDAKGNLYGVASGGGASGAGVVFKIDPSGNETVLYNFTGLTDGGTPYTNVLRDNSGNLYGATWGGGPAGVGVVYKLDTAGHETVLLNFSGVNGSNPYGNLFFSQGSLFGTATGGGVHQGGVVFQVGLQ